MIDKFRKNVTIERLNNDLFLAQFQRDSSFIISYPEFLSYFQNFETITKHNLVIGINFTYAWMPTIFDYRSNDFDKALVILNRAKQGEIPTNAEFTILKGLFNNSLVGTSKLLHFINPEKFAIWDSRVYLYLTGLPPYGYRIDNNDAFLSYLNFCNEITNMKEYEKIHNEINIRVGFEMTKKRTLELLMYLMGGG